MVKERTLSIIKPDAVQKNHIGDIIGEFEKNGLKIAACRLMQLSDQQAKDFYAVHKERPFYNDLVQFMTSGPVVVMVLEGDNAIAKNREIMGDTNPESARKNAPNSIRARFAETIDANAVHGSDGADTAKNEILFFFPNGEVVARH